LSEDGCLEWSQEVACQQGEVCQEGLCAPACVDTCPEQGARACIGDAQPQVCALSEDGCLGWSLAAPCGQGEVCQGDGLCQPTCLDGCDTAQARRCVGDDQVQTCAPTPEGCLQWSSAQSCGDGAVCQGEGTCVELPVCEDLCQQGVLRCDAEVIQVCARGDEGCLGWQDRATCEEGTTCQEGACEPVEPPDMGLDVDPEDMDAAGPDAEVDADEPDAQVDADEPDAELDMMEDVGGDLPEADMGQPDMDQEDEARGDDAGQVARSGSRARS
jgi:hypothetical protein